VVCVALLSTLPVQIGPTIAATLVDRKVMYKYVPPIPLKVKFQGRSLSRLRCKYCD
jgi:hypothetical protein